MAEPESRTIIEGIDFGSIVHFPRILRSITGALQPPRLVLGLLMVTALITAGRVWDRMTEPTIPPGGLLSAPWTDDSERGAQEVLRAALVEYGGADPELLETAAGDEESWLDARRVLVELQKGYRARRAERMASTADAQLAREDGVFIVTLRRVDDIRPRGDFEAAVDQVSDSFARIVRGVVTARPAEVYEGAEALFVRTPVALWDQARPFTVVYGIIFLVVMALGGGALSRHAAVQWAGQDRISIRQSIDFALENWVHLLLAPVLPLLLAAILAGVIMLLGLLIRLPWFLELLGAVAYGPALLLAAMMAFLLLGFILGASLLVPAVACENCDAADAQQRAYAYVLNRPVHRIVYGFIGLVGMSLGYVVIGFFALTMLNGAAGLFATFGGDHPAIAAAGGAELFNLSGSGVQAYAGTWSEAASGAMVGFWRTLVLCLVPAWAIAYYFSASSLIYLLMRRACDGQDLQEIWLPGLTPGSLTPEPEPIGEGSD